MKKINVAILILSMIAVSGLSAEVHYVGPADDLQAILDHPSYVLPGDTIIVTGNWVGSYSSSLQGELGKPIYLVMDEATIDGELLFFAGGEVVVFGTWGNELYDSALSADGTVGGLGLDVRVPGVRLINLQVRDLKGFGFWRLADRGEIYGLDVTNIGYDRASGETRDHGHGIYMQNLPSKHQRIIENVFTTGNMSTLGFKLYGEDAAAEVENMTLIRNVTPQRLVVASLTTANGNNPTNILISDHYGPLRPADVDATFYCTHCEEVEIRRSILNYVYVNPPAGASDPLLGLHENVLTGSGAAHPIVGHKTGVYDLMPDADWDHNIWAGDRYLCDSPYVGRWDGSPNAHKIRPAGPSTCQPESTHCQEYFCLSELPRTEGDYGHESFQDKWGLELNGSADKDFFSEPQVFMWQNRYDETRARIVVYNGDDLNRSGSQFDPDPVVSFDPTFHLRRGDAWQLVNAADRSQTVSGTNWQPGEEILIPMGEWSTAPKLSNGVVKTEMYPHMGAAILRNLTREASYWWLPREAARALWN